MFKPFAPRVLPYDSEQRPPAVEDNTLQFMGNKTKCANSSLPPVSKVEQLYRRFLAQQAETDPETEPLSKEELQALEEEFASMQLLANELEVTYHELVNSRSPK